MRAILLVLPMLAACPADGNSDAQFLGSYKTTITLSGQGSQTFTDTMTIAEGETSELVLQSQQLGVVQADVLGHDAIQINQQMITLTDSTGHAFSVTIQGQGTVNSGVFSASGTMSGSGGVLSYTINGSKL
jgi:hypothetical protein